MCTHQPPFHPAAAVNSEQLAAAKWAKKYRQGSEAHKLAYAQITTGTSSQRCYLATCAYQGTGTDPGCGNTGNVMPGPVDDGACYAFNVSLPDSMTIH